jgi:hypothetical protein
MPTTATTTAARPHVYVDCDLPEGMALSAWRRERAVRGEGRPPRRRMLRRAPRRRT